MKQTISILGCGWLGEPLAQHLIHQGYHINGSTTSENKIHRLRSYGVSPFLLSLESLPTNLSSFLDAEILIINIPSKSIEGFKNLICYIEKSAVKKVVFISSTSVYDNLDQEITESSPVNNSPLVKIEQLFSTNHTFFTTIIRFAGLIGYNRKPGNFYLANTKITNPEGTVNMIHRDDCINIIDLVVSKNIWNETFNACADSHPSRREFYSKAALDIGKELPTFDETSPLEMKIISNKKLKTMLVYKFK